MAVSAKQKNTHHRRIESILRPPKFASLCVLCVMSIWPAGISSAETTSTQGSVGTAESREQRKPFKVMLMWMDPSRSLPFGPERVAREVTSILAAAGIEVLLCTDGDSLTASSSIHRVIPVVLISTDSSVWGIENNALGTVSGPAVTPHVYVFLPNILRALGCPPWMSHRKIPAIAAALGRVAAHEIFHVLCPNEPHATEGLMVTRWNVLHLSKRQFDLSEHSIDVLLPASSPIGPDSLSSKDPDDKE